MKEPRRPYFFTYGIVLAFAFVLAACSETELAFNTAKKLGDQTSQPLYKIGNPYQIDGVWYYPAVDHTYTETGIASWYGADFHRRLTANGELYDMNLVSAAHRTLPLPSIVRVTNLENGRSLKVRVNDRGPFARGRILDLSRRSAELLGFLEKGTAKVRVEILKEESVQVADTMRSGVSMPPPGESIVFAAAHAEPAPPIAAIPLEPIVTIENVKPTHMFVQAGAFAQHENATTVSTRLQKFGEAKIVSVTVGDQALYRVRVGPLASVEEADTMLDQVVKAGYPEARLIVD